MKALLLDPYHTGSHAHWAKGMQKHLSQIRGTAVELWTMPGRHWKWRMHGAVVNSSDRSFPWGRLSRSM